MDTCLNCTAYHPEVNSPHGDGECRKDPPVPTTAFRDRYITDSDGKNINRYRSQFAWPDVLETDWCRQHSDGTSKQEVESYPPMEQSAAEQPPADPPVVDPPVADPSPARERVSRAASA